jgi:hypothetical protein
MKPTKAQRAVLERMAGGEPLVYFADFNLAALGSERLNVQTFVVMVRRGLVTYAGARWTAQGIPCGTNYILTDDGLAALGASA